jgi:hypothetical protein
LIESLVLFPRAMCASLALPTSRIDTPKLG